jgi:branched-subunit amino acid ABC-type transport system permease component
MTTAPPERSRVHRVTGITVGVILALLALGLAFAIYTTFFTFRDPSGELASVCASAQTVGTHCSQSFLDTICYIGYAVCLFGWGIPVGFMVVRLIQKRRAWYWPLIAIAVVYLGYFLLTAILGAGYPPK